MFFSNTNRTNRTNLLGCDIVYIREIRGICGQLKCNNIYANIFFSNTNRTNRTNLFIYDSKMNIRDIREITSLWSVGFDKSRVLLKIFTRMFFRTLIARIKLILQVCGTCFIKDKMLDKLLTLNSNNSLCQLVSRQLVYF